MMENQLLKLAEKYLQSRGIGYLPPGKIGRSNMDRWEVIFPAPETLDESIAVLDPGDVRVWVTPEAGIVELIDQM